MQDSLAEKYLEHTTENHKKITRISLPKMPSQPIFLRAKGPLAVSTGELVEMGNSLQ